jgi:hypothetical protein
VIDRVAELEREVARLRARTHEIAAAKDAEHAARLREVNSLRATIACAQRWADEHLVADWTPDKAATFFRWTSEINREALIGLLMRAGEIPRPEVST